MAKDIKKGFVTIPTSQLVKAGWNYKLENDELAVKLTENIKRNGQIENIIVRQLDSGFFEVVNGNHRYDVLSALDYKDVYCYNLGKITQSQAMRIAIETNETKFASDQQQLSLRMKELTDEFGPEDLLSSMPFNEDELKAMLTLEDFNYADLEDSIPGEKKPKTTSCPECGHEFTL